MESYFTVTASVSWSAKEPSPLPSTTAQSGAATELVKWPAASFALSYGLTLICLD